MRCLMQEASRLSEQPLEEMSFTGTRDSTEHWVGAIVLASSQKARNMAMDGLYRCIASDLLPRRPGRSEPRAVKRRPKGYQLLTRPRKEMVVSPSRKRK